MSKNTCIYEVNIDVDNDAADDFVQWLHSEHFKDMLSLDGFEQANLYTLRDGHPNALGKSFTCSYRVASEAHLDAYLNGEDVKRMRAEGLQKFPNKFRATRRILHTQATYEQQ